MTKGSLIIIEGADGTGKATQLESVVKILSKNNIKYKTFDFPRYYDNFWGKMIGRYLNKEFGDTTAISPYMRTLFYILDQADARDEIKQSIDEGYIVLCNRYTTSNAFQAVGFDDRKGRNQYWKWLEQAAYEELGATKPDLVIVLYADPKVAFSNIEKKAKRGYTQNKRDMNETKFDLQKEAANELKYQTKKREDWRLVSVTEKGQMRKVDKITEDIIQILSSFTNLKIKL